MTKKWEKLLKNSNETFLMIFKLYANAKNEELIGLLSYIQFITSLVNSSYQFFRLHSLFFSMGKKNEVGRFE